MAWIESHQELQSHKKTRRLTRFLEVSLPQAIGHLHLLWWWALKYADDGDLSDLAAADIAEAALWEGKPEVFLRALIDSGFIDETDDGNVLHDWWDYAGKLMERRKADAERKRRTHNSSGTPLDIRRNSGGTPKESVRNPDPNNDPNNDLKTLNTPPNPRKRGQFTEFELDFETLWGAYPRKTNKAGALVKYAATRRKGASAEDLLIAVQHYALSRQGEEPAFTMHGATFFGPQQRWRDFLNPPDASEIGKPFIRRGNSYADHTADGPKWLPNSGFKMANRTGKRSVGENA